MASAVTDPVADNPAPPRAGYLEVLRGNRNYRLLWSGDLVSLLGDWFNLIASATLIGMLTQSGAAVGGLLVVRWLAPFAVSPLAGVVADRFNRKHLLIAADLIRAVVVLGFLFIRRPEQVWLLYVLTAVQLGISGFFFPARNAILPSLVTPRELGAANAISSATWSSMLAFGTALGGLVAGTFGLHVAFLIDAATFLASAAFISRIRYHAEAEVQAHAPGPGAVLRQYLAGLGFLRAHPGILVLALQKPLYFLTCNGGFQVIMVTLAERVYAIGHGGGISMGLLFASVGVGTGLGPILARTITGDREPRMRVAVGSGYGVMALGLGLVASLGPLPVILIGCLLQGFGGGMIWVFSTQLLLQKVPGPVRGRVFSTEFALLTLLGAMCAATTGWAVDRPGWGLQPTIVVVALLPLLPATAWALWLLRPPAREI